MPRSPIPQSIAVESLQGVSYLAAEAWQRLSNAEDPETESAELEWLWQMQDSQETLIDAHVELAQQMDAEIAGVTARMQHLMQIHQKEIDRLTRWRTGLDRAILNLNQAGVLGTEAAGKTHSIRIKLNPPSCEVVQQSEIPGEYVGVTEEVVIKTTIDKAAIKQAWLRGVAVPGVKVSRRQKVVYEQIPTSLERMRAKGSVRK
ncbi:MAG TPA: siphovirus Gp157 family protein [Thermosynechococcaceae cyanobacterium]